MKSDDNTKTPDAKAKGKMVKAKVLIREGVETSAGTAYNPAKITLPKAEAETLQAEGKIKIL